MKAVARLGEKILYFDNDRWVLDNIEIPFESFPLYAKACVEKYNYEVVDEELYESLDI